MLLTLQPLNINERTQFVRKSLDEGARLGLITSIDGNQLITVLLYPTTGAVTAHVTELDTPAYRSMTPAIPQAHWFERTICDMFGVHPDGHPQLKGTHLHEPYANVQAPLAMPSKHSDRNIGGSDNKGGSIDTNNVASIENSGVGGIQKSDVVSIQNSESTNAGKLNRNYQFLSVAGDGIYEIPVGPIHAGVIEPGHFRFSCNGEQIVNLEIRLGYVHRGVEKRLTQVDWRKARFVAEAAASDMPVANALAHAIAMESLAALTVPPEQKLLRTLALEIERVAMHIADLGGIAGDIGFLAVATSMSRLRGNILRMGEIVSGNRFMRGFICPGGTIGKLDKEKSRDLLELSKSAGVQFDEITNFLMKNSSTLERTRGIGTVKPSLAKDLGLVGIAARACGIEYDARHHVQIENNTNPKIPIALETSGDVHARAKVRIEEVRNSLRLIKDLLEESIERAEPTIEAAITLPQDLHPNSVAVGIVESHRGELLHMVFTDDHGRIARYCIKDASVNNWPALALAMRQNLVTDFPLCNKSFSLSYGGHDL